MSFSQLGLSPAVLKAVEGSGYTVPTPIQKQAIPEVMAGRDVMACAPTGTGKTAAFVLPMLDRLQRDSAPEGKNLPRALIITPTRELAQQIEASVLCYGAFTSIQSIAVYGGVFQSPQVQGMKCADVIIATPGRLLDHLRGNTANLSAVEYLVVDEADRMFDMGFAEDVQNIIGRIKRDRQTLLFSATMSDEVQSLIASIQRDPVKIIVGQTNKPVNTVLHYFYRIDRHAKIDLLSVILKRLPAETVLVFSRTKLGVNQIARQLQRRGIIAEAIHSDRLQSQREQVMAGFKRRDFNVLVATDIAARGIDVDGISYVINYDTPMAPEDYVHRIGRTGRAEASGTAVTFVSSDEDRYFRAIEQTIGKKCELRTFPGFEPGTHPEPQRHSRSRQRHPREREHPGRQRPVYGRQRIAA
ncbi:MAG: DEAD/DEAH box helicase [Chitinispirillaceae bacterium]|nr:DEAD/DEAH box helicase [Chitinispirillaceae bacterium]